MVKKSKAVERGQKAPIFSPSDLLKMSIKRAERLFNSLTVHEQIDMILKARGKYREAIILLSKKPEELVRLIPEEEIFFTIKEIGENDAITLISLLNPQQLLYVMDLEMWKKGQFITQKFIQWLQILLECGEEKVIEWIQHMDMETVVLALKKHVRIYKVTDEEDLGETLEKFPYVTIDYVYFIQFLDEDTQRILYPIFDIVKRNDELLFNTIMEGLIWELDSELEEEAHRWKESRLEEKGFPRFNEVMDIYQYVPSEKIKTLPQKEKKTFMSEQRTISPYYPLVLLEKQMFFSHCLNLIHEPEEQNRIRTELVTLSNKIMMADGADIGKIENIEVALHKVSGYLNIGLQIISKGNVESAVDYLKVYFLQHIFQVGYSETIRLQEKAKKLTMHGWEEKFNEFKYMINSPWIEYLEGTRRKRPLFFCNYERGLEYREFRDMQEIVTVNNALDMIEYLGSLFIERLNFTLDTMRSIWLHNKREEKDLKLSIVLLTAFANMILHGEFVFRPILTSDLERLLDRTFICNNENALPRKIKKEVKEDFLGWLYLQQGDISNKEKTLCHTFVEDSFYALEEEFGYLDIRDGIDPKFLNELFIILPEFTS